MSAFISARLCVLMLAAFIGYVGMNLYYKLNPVNSPQKTPQPTNIGSQESKDAVVASPEIGSAQNKNTGSASQSSSLEQHGSNPSVFCGVQNMPEKVCETITSIEKDGPTSKFITADVSKIPRGTKIDINEKAWIQPGPELGSAPYTATYSKNSFTGKMSFQLVSTQWKVFSYTIDQ